MDQSELIIRLENVAFGYPGGPPVLSDLNFQLERGCRMGLMGANGSGKTTLFHIIMGLLKPTAGRVALFGRQVREEKEFSALRPRIGLLFQDADDQLFSPTVLEDVAFGPLNLGKSPEEAAEIARRTLASLDLRGFEERLTYKLSGGEKRLVSLATVLSMEPEVLLLDEPTTGLDDRTKSRLREILPHLGLSYVVISHEMDFLHDTTESLAVIREGTIRCDENGRIHQHFHYHPHGGTPHKHH